MDPTRRTLSHSSVQHVLITGGTHGNEANGVYLAKHFLQSPEVATRPSFTTSVELANPAAIAANLRYVDTDMNRCFLLHDLADDSLASGAGFEPARAKVINAKYGPKSSGRPSADLCIDLHNTTANTGVALMMAHDDAFAHEIAAHLMSLPIGSGIRVVEWAPADDYAMLPSIGRSGMTFEVGSCPWGCLEGKWYAKSRELVLAALDFVHQHNLTVACARKALAGRPLTGAPAGAGAAGDRAPPLAMGTRSIPIYRRVLNIDYPREEGGAEAGSGDIAGMVHPSLQHKDFDVITEGQGLFLMLDGSTRSFAAAEHGWDSSKHGEPHAFFINEAAYYEKGVALCLSERLEVEFSVLAAKLC